ncbi:THO complex subunit 6 [Cimex lectularius]|uniref:THO complex subunit 6 n=1 Tax=Cimex lectularius TaxID=79782 RepID=A0A8I6TFF4_CIMLE|nr:THO complex subunit 6 [Cimex lectularius]
MVDKKFYNTVLSQVFSPCGNWLICGCIYGDIAIFDLKSILKDNENADKVPKHIYTVPNKEQVCSLSSSDKFLIVGTVGAIFGLDWDTIKSLSPQVSWTITLPTSNDKLLKTDVNSMFVKENAELYAGCGDCTIYAFSLEDGKMIRNYKGHTDYIHSITTNEQIMASASEDGSVRLWDFRQPGMTNMLEPSKDPKLSRPHLGKWIGDVDLTQDWMVCGGGPGLGLWHLRTLEMMSIFNSTSDNIFHITKLQGGSVLAGGSGNHFYQLSYTGQVLSKLQTSSSTIYSALYTTTPNEVLTLAGASSSIDICTNFTYSHQVVSFYS